MTLSAAPALAGPFDGNGIADEFSFDFKVFNTSDLLVVKFSVLDVESTLVNGVDYTVTLNSDQDANPGGIVLHPVAGTKLATGERLTITTQLAIEQSTDLTNQGLFYPQTVETMVDRVVALVRQVEASSARAVQLPLSLADSDPSLPTPVPGAALMWNETGDAIINGIMTESLVALSSFMANVIQAADAAEARSDIGAAGDAAVVKLTGAQTVAGVKTFSDSPIVPTPTTDFQVSTKAYADTAAAASPPAGAVMFFAMSTTPTGWLKADGALVSRATYAALFAAIGTTFGVGDGSTTFGLPDLRGEFIRGFDDGKGTDGSRVFGSAQAGQMQSHTHTFNSNGNGNGNSSNYTLGGSEYSVPTVVTVSAAGGTTNSSENRPRNIALLACIKY